MANCIICRFEVHLDDAVVPTGTGRCICLRCYARETGSQPQISRRLHDELAAIATAAGME